MHVRMRVNPLFARRSSDRVVAHEKIFCGKCILESSILLTL